MITFMQAKVVWETSGRFFAVNICPDQVQGNTQGRYLQTASSSKSVGTCHRSDNKRCELT